MKKVLLLICLAGFIHLKAQYVTIPDAKFVTYLQNIVPAAMNGNQMDTTSVDVTSNTTIIYVENDSIGDLTGIQYFDSLKTLDCGNGLNVPTANFVTNLPKLPTTLEVLICGRNKLANLPNLPNTLITIKCYGNLLHNLPVLPTALQFLDCSEDSLTTLPSLPATLQYLHCGANSLTSLPNLPASLTSLICVSNQLTSLPSLPNMLSELTCNINQLSYLPVLPASLVILNCATNQIVNLTGLPASLTGLICSSNQIVSLPPMPASLTSLICDNNQISTLPVLPNTITYLECCCNHLTGISTLPDSLRMFDCQNNQITSLAALPTLLTRLVCNNNQLSSLPVLPDSLKELFCQGNHITCFPVFPNSLAIQGNCQIFSNPFTCLPNYVPAMDTSTLAYPLCTSGNSNGCPNAQGIFGYTYKDVNSNCIRNPVDTNLKNISVHIYDNSNNLLGQTYSALNGAYNFPQTTGTYTVVVDTIGSVPFVAQCNNLGLDTTVTVAAIDTNVNFSLTCKPGFDIGVLSTAVYGFVFPGQQFTLNTIAGDVSKWYGLNCAAGIIGQVQITITGPVAFIGPAAGALTPGVNGNTYTYNITDFGAINIETDFNLLFAVNTSAQAGDLFCVNISITPTTGDNNLGNNNYSFCFSVQNSHDPNLKETYPVNVAPGYNDWFTYTIHFQNTGTAAAMNINLSDTLDHNLDMKTFQVVNYSHKNTVWVNGSILTFNFSNINLPDSFSNPTGSIGYVQYRIKPKPNLPAGTRIKNTAYIYFDYNAPVITDTTINTFIAGLGISRELNSDKISVYPNPAKGTIYVASDANIDEIKVTDMLGQVVYEIKPNAVNAILQIDNAGIYFITITSGKEVITEKILVAN